MKEIKGQLTAGKGKYAIVVSRFNEFITSRLLAGAVDCLKRHGAADEQMLTVWVPGACEIVPVARKLAQSGKFAAVLCLGAIIRGQTQHYEAVCQQVSRGIGQINYDSKAPAVFGVLTCETLEEAVDRAGAKKGNAGADAAMTAMEMASVLEQI
jgi:6,7-dimethyl-8-ribityllumazine synthase